MSDEVAVMGADPAPDSPLLADAAARWRSAYIHIPFCRRRCPYCDFAVVTPDEGGTPDIVRRYRAALAAEIGMEPEFGPLDAVNFGGGTPSTVAAGDVAEVLTELDNCFAIMPGAEVSLEANPEDWDLPLATALVEAGITRVSLGVQSFADDTLEKLGSLPDATHIYCGHEYTESNFAFAAHLEPDNEAVQQKLASVRQIRAGAAADWHDATPAEMTIPSTMAEERATNPFVRAADAEDLGRIRTLKDNF